MAPLVKALEKYSVQIETVVTVKAQHRQMLDQVLDIFDIKPGYDLNIMRDKQTLAGITTCALEGLYEVMGRLILSIHPGWACRSGLANT